MRIESLKAATLIRRPPRLGGLHFRRRLMLCAGAAAVLLCQEAWARHWYMTGVVKEKHGDYVGGFDADAIQALSPGRFQIIVVTYFMNKPTVMKGVAEIEVDCAGRRYRFTGIKATNSQGITKGIISHPLEWDSVKDDDEMAEEDKVSIESFNAVCSKNYNGLIDIGHHLPEKYVQDLQSQKSQ